MQPWRTKTFLGKEATLFSQHFVPLPGGDSGSVGSGPGGVDRVRKVTAAVWLFCVQILSYKSSLEPDCFQSILCVWYVPKPTAFPCHCWQLNNPILLGSLLS